MARRLPWRAAAALACTLLLLSPLAPAAEPEAGHGAEPGGEHAIPAECPTAMSEAADEECAAYWENHINWFSWDYKAGPGQAPEHRHMPPPFFFALVNFAVFLWIMWRLAARPLADYVRARHATIRKDLDEAQRLHREAEARLAEYSGRIAGLDQEIDQLLAQVKGEALAEKQRIIAEAEAQAARLREEAAAQIQVELRRMQRGLSREAVAAAMAAAEQVLATRTTDDDQARLTERFVGQLEAAPPGAENPRS
jgi:F-type H+-transporting ATPase subunit b